MTDRQRANVLIHLASGGEEVVGPDADRVLRTMKSNHVVRVRRTHEGHTVYRATPAGQRWAVEQLATTSAGHAGNIARKRTDDVLVIEERRDGEWRVVDHARRIRTPWLYVGSRTPIVERAARAAIRHTDSDKLIPHRHTRDGDWIIVHSL